MLSSFLTNMHNILTADNAWYDFDTVSHCQSFKLGVWRHFIIGASFNRKQWETFETLAAADITVLLLVLSMCAQFWACAHCSTRVYNQWEQQKRTTQKSAIVCVSTAQYKQCEKPHDAISVSVYSNAVWLQLWLQLYLYSKRWRKICQLSFVRLTPLLYA